MGGLVPSSGRLRGLLLLLTLHTAFASNQASPANGEGEGTAPPSSAAAVAGLVALSGGGVYELGLGGAACAASAAVVVVVVIVVAVTGEKCDGDVMPYRRPRKDATDERGERKGGG